MAVGTWYDTVDPSLFSRQEGARMGSQVGNQIANTRASFARDAQAQDIKDRTRMAIEDVAAYANSPEGHAADEMTFQVNLLKVLNNHGAQPGPIFNRLLEIKRADVKARKEKAQAQGLAEQLSPDPLPQMAPTTTTDPYGPHSDRVESPTNLDFEGRPITSLADIRAANEQQAPAFEAAGRTRDVLGEMDPSVLQKAAVDRLLEKPEKPQWSEERGAWIYPDRAVIPRDLPTKAPKAPDVKADGAGNLWAYNAATGRYDTPASGPEFAPKKESGRQSSLSLLIADRNAMPEGSPDRRYYDAAIAKATSSRGLRVKTNPDGTVEVSEGGMDGGGPGLAKPTVAKVESNILETGDTLRRLNGLERDFDANNQRIAPRLAAWSASWKDKANIRLTPEDKINLEVVTKQRKKAFDILNSELNRLSGAAVSDQELARLTKGLPNPGTGVFDGDSPIEFETKMRETISGLRSAMARYSYIRRHGLTVNDIDLSDMPALMNQRGTEIEAALRAKKIPEAEVRKKARAMLADEFGLIQ